MQQPASTAPILRALADRRNHHCVKDVRTTVLAAAVSSLVRFLLDQLREFF